MADEILETTEQSMQVDADCEVSKSAEETLAALALYRTEHAPKVIKQALYEGLLRGESIMKIDAPALENFTDFKNSIL
jgi:hypothetical protein